MGDMEGVLGVKEWVEERVLGVEVRVLGVEEGVLVVVRVSVDGRTAGDRELRSTAVEMTEEEEEVVVMVVVVVMVATLM